MAYVKTEWANNTTPPINAANLNKIENELETLENSINGILNLVYPVGSYYWSSESTDPGQLFGGTWTQVKDKFILALGDAYPTPGATGGSSTQTLTVNNIPSHNHPMNPEAYMNANGSNNKFFAAAGSGTYMNTVSQGGRSADHNTGNRGSGQAFSIMPPYEIAYCWKRTA